MALAADLEAEFAADGFSLSATLDVSAGDLAAVTLEAPAISSDDLGPIVDGLGDGDVATIVGSLDALLGVVGGTLTDFPDVDAVLRPLEAVLDLAQVITGPDIAAVPAAVEAAGAEGGTGLAALDAHLRAAGTLLDDPSVGTLLDLATSTLGDTVDVDGAIGDLGTWLRAGRHAVELIGALMSVESATGDLRRVTELASGMLVPGEVVTALSDVSRFTTSSLDELLTGIDPDDAGLVALVVPSITAYTTAMRRLAGIVRRGMSFGEATLAHGGLQQLSTRIDTAAAGLREEGLDTVRAAAEQLAEWLQPLLDIELPDAQEGLDALAGEVVGLVTDLAGAVDRLDPVALAAPVTAGLGQVTSVLGDVAVAAEEVRTALTTALTTVRDAVAVIDLTPVIEAIQDVLRPVADALDAIGQLVDGAQSAIEDAAGSALDALNSAQTSLGTAADAVAVAFDRLQQMIDALGLETLREQLDQLVTPVADTLASIDLAPYFDDAASAISTTADVIEAVPLDLLPDDAQEELADAVEPVRRIDFQRDVADVLNARLAEVFDALDTEILTAIEAAYGEVVEFVAGIDPTEPLVAFEEDVFDPLLAAVRDVDLEAVFAPVDEVLQPLREAVEGFDPFTEVLAPADEAVAAVAEEIAALDPATLLTPLEEQVDEIRAGITAALRLDDWGDWLDGAEEQVDGVAARIDPAHVVALLDAAHERLNGEVRRGGSAAGRPPGAPGPSVTGTMIAALLESDGAGIRAATFSTVCGWIGGADAARSVSTRLTAAADALDAQLAAVEQVDLAALIAELQPLHRRLTAALEAHPPDSLLRLRLDVELSAASPQELFGPLVGSRDGYLASLREVTALVRRLAASGRSEMTAVAAGLRAALRPLQAVLDRARALLVNLGVTVEGLTPREIAVQLLTAFRPSVLLAPLVDVAATLRDRVVELIVEGLLGPLREAVGSVDAAVAAVDIGFIRTEVGALHADIVAMVESLSPSVILGPVLEEFDELRTTVVEFDPLGPVRTVVDELTELIDTVDGEFRPTVLFAPVTDLHAQLVEVLGALDLGDLLSPVFDALEVIETELGGGLDRTAQALGELQDALPSGSSGNDASAGAAISVGVG